MFTKTTTVKKTITVIRETTLFQLYSGYGPTADRYWVLRYKTSKDGIAISNPFLELQKDELLKLSDEDFNITCSKLNFT